MTPSEFKSRFISTLPKSPDGIDLSLDRFTSFPLDRIAKLRINEADRKLLADCGLPLQAAPFLSFGLPDEWVFRPLDDFPESIAIGQNGCGDLICLDQSANGAVVYFNHDDNMKRIFINSSLVQFAESLCLFSVFLQTNDSNAFLQQLYAADPAAHASDTFWPKEVQLQIEN